ncbi:MAG: diphthamide biosynthesis enzyme Dph2 [Candidatus Aenigmarchaeota archaeon]|nr:diphthamide biosynthesis enzyme Dph2 [Candidatus Aenigmarchaeota archaeon]
MFADISEAIREIKSKDYKRILIQVPEGLKTEVSRIASKIEKECCVDVFIAAEPCYGACDLPLKEAEVSGCDIIIHFGHYDFGVKTQIPVVYVPVEIKAEISEELKKEIEKIEEKKIGIYSSEPFRRLLESFRDYLEDNGKEVVDKRIILGCSDFEPLGELNIFIGSGKFHPLALKGKTYFLNLEKNRFEDLSGELMREEMRKAARVSKFKDAKKVGILVSTKPGQFYKEYEQLEDKLREQGKKTKILIFDMITNEKLMGLDFEVYVNTACPRILDNPFDKPVVNLRDLSV